MISARNLPNGNGYVNRAVTDVELDAFVDRFAKRVAGFEKEAI